MLLLVCMRGFRNFVVWFGDLGVVFLISILVALHQLARTAGGWVPTPQGQTPLQSVGDRFVGFRLFSRDGTIRTSNLLVPNQVRYQIAPHPEGFESLRPDLNW